MNHSIVKFIVFVVMFLGLLLASMFGTVSAVEVHKNGFGGITPLNTTGLTVFNDSLKRSFDYESDSLVLSSEFSILETNGDVRDFSLFDNDLTLQNGPQFEDSTFRTSLYTDGPNTEFANAPHSETLDMEETNISIVWWGELRNEGHDQYIMGKIGTSPPSPSVPYHYGLWLNTTNAISAVVTSPSPYTIDWITSDFEIDTNRTYGIGITFEDNASGAIVDFWVDGNWIYQEQSTERVGDAGLEFRVGARNVLGPSGCNCTHDEILVFKELLDNSTMQSLTTKQHDIVIKSGPRTTTQGFEGLLFALPWLIVFGLLAWLGFIIFMAWREPFTGG